MAFRTYGGTSIASDIALVWMDPCSTDKTFDEYFYQDRDDLHRNGDE
jgi:hypothetical protein